MRPSVVCNQAQTRVAQVLRLELHVQCMVAAGAEASAHVDSRVLRVRLSGAFRAARGEIIKRARSSSGRISGGDQRVAQIQLAGAELVDVFDVIEVNAVRAAITQFHNRVSSHLGCSPRLQNWVCAVLMLGSGMRNSTGGSYLTARQAQRTEIVIGDVVSASGGVCRANIANYSAGRRVKAGVIRHVAEVAFVADAETAAQTALAVAEDIIGEPNARCEGAPTRLPELPNRTLIRNLDSTGSNLLLNTAARTEIEVGVQVGWLLCCTP